MTVEDIQTLAESYVDDTIEDADAIRWTNDFMEEAVLVEVFRYTAAQSLIVADSDTWYDRTGGHLQIVEILDSDSDKYTGEYEINYDRDEIRIPDADTYTITSITLPTSVTAIANTPVINTVFHKAMATYMAGKFKLQDNDQNDDGLRLVYEGIGKAKAAAKLLRSHDKREQSQTKRMTWE